MVRTKNKRIFSHKLKLKKKITRRQKKNLLEIKNQLSKSKNTNQNHHQPSPPHQLSLTLHCQPIYTTNTPASESNRHSQTRDRQKKEAPHHTTPHHNGHGSSQTFLHHQQTKRRFCLSHGIYIHSSSIFVKSALSFLVFNYRSCSVFVCSLLRSPRNLVLS